MLARKLVTSYLIVAAAAALLLALFAGSASASFQFLGEFGSFGSGPGQFNTVPDLATAPAGDLWVSDSLNARVQRLKADGTFVQQISGPGTGGGELAGGVVGVDVDVLGNLYVADTNNSRVQKFDPQGNFVATWGYGVQDGSNAFQICTSDCQVGIVGSGPGQLNGPNDVDIGPDGKIYVVNTGNNRVEVYTPSFAVDGSYGGFGDGAGQLYEPLFIAFDSDGNSYVTELNNNRVSKFDTSHNFVVMWGAGVQDGTDTPQTCMAGCQTGLASNVVGAFQGPTGISIDDADKIYVSDNGNYRIDMFETDAGYLGAINGTPGTGPGEFADLWGSVIDCQGSLWLADRQNRVQRFGEPGVQLCSAAPSNNPGTTNPSNPSSGGAEPAKSELRLSKLAISPTKLRLQCKKKRSSKRKRCKPRSATLSYELSQAASVSFTIERKLTGRRVAGKCRRTTAKNKRRKRCVFYRTVTSFKQAGMEGRNTARFTGKIGKRTLRRGGYRVSAIASDSAGQRSNTATTNFKMPRPRLLRR